MAETYEARYEAVTAALAQLAGQRVRVTFRSLNRLAGVVSTKVYSQGVDVLIDGHGGQMYGEVTRIEQKEGRRYSVKWEDGQWHS